MGHEKLFELARPYLDRNDFGTAHTRRVFNIARDILTREGYDDSLIQEVCRIIRSHHNHPENPSQAFRILYDLEDSKNLAERLLERRREKTEAEYQI